MRPNFTRYHLPRFYSNFTSPTPLRGTKIIFKNPKKINNALSTSISAHQESGGHQNHGGGHGHGLGDAYYSLTLATVFFGGIYAFFSGEAQKKVEKTWYNHNQPTNLNKVTFGAFEPHQQIPKSVVNQLKRKFLSPKNHENIKRLVICGKGGMGKLAAAMHSAYASDENNKDDPNFRSSIINLRGHSMEAMEDDIISAAVRFGINLKNDELVINENNPNRDKVSDLKAAKSFLSQEIKKRPGATIIVRCLRCTDVLQEVEKIINPPSRVAEFSEIDGTSAQLPDFKYPSIQFPSAKLSLIVTTGDEGIESELKKQKYESISLDKSFTKEDLDVYLSNSDFDNHSIQRIGSATKNYLVNNILDKNPTLARIAIAYFKKNPELNIAGYRSELDSCKEDTVDYDMEHKILKLSLEQLKKEYPLSEKILIMISPGGVLQSAGLFVNDLVEDKSVLEEIPDGCKQNAEQYIRKNLDALEEMGLINVNTNKDKIYQTIMISQACYLRGESVVKKDNPTRDAKKNSFVEQFKANNKIGIYTKGGHQ
ncbi:MAG: hypothetical protein ACI9TO_000783 [Rickettsiales bacterium]|jgi:hypothetical protein